MSTVDTDYRREFLKLLRFNYENLHSSVWEAHRVFWTMTNIFVPIIFGALGFLIIRLEDSNRLYLVAGALVILAVIWFWYGVFRVLDRYNSQRRRQLQEIEDAFNAHFEGAAKETGVSFGQYRLLKERGTGGGGWGFGSIVLSLSVFLSVVLVVAVVVAVTASTMCP